MSNTVKISLKVEYFDDGTLIRQVPLKAYSLATTSDLKTDNVQIVGTTHELIDVGDVTDDAIAIIENIHASAVVSVGGDNTGAFVPWFFLNPGDPPAILPNVDALASTYLKSDTASTPVQVILYKVVAP